MGHDGNAGHGPGWLPCLADQQGLTDTGRIA
jgi:hypothetical protein